MAETEVSFVLKQLWPLLLNEGILLYGVKKDFTDIKDELESMQAFLKEADRRAGDEGDTNEGIKTWVKQLREASFKIEDVIDEYIMYVAPRIDDPGCMASLQNIAHMIKNLMHRHWIASEIQNIKSSVSRIKERSARYKFQPSLEHGSSSSGIWNDPRLAALFIEEAEVVGFENPRDELVGWLVDGAIKRTVISVVGMGGLGKTTLAKNVFENQQVKGHFDCHAFIIVSQSYSIKGLLINLMKEFCKNADEPHPEGINTMEKTSLISEVRRYLQEKRYVIFFDDVWKVDFWDGIQLAALDNEKGSRIVITSRNLDVATYCKKDPHVQVLMLQPLPANKAWELFCKKAFHNDFNGNCPSELEVISNEIVQKCEGLPLAIVAIGGLLSTKDKNVFVWKTLLQNLSFELGRNPHLTSLTRILALSYDDLPYYLKSCILYFGIYPEDYSIRCMRLVRQWIAEGFVIYEEGKTLEEVAEKYLTELINRSLVQVSKNDYGKALSCRVHDFIRDMVIRKMKDLNFCRVVHEVDQPTFDVTTRRLAIATSARDVLTRVAQSNSKIRSMYIFEAASELPDQFLSGFFAKSKLVKMLHLEGSSLSYVPNDLGNNFHLRYLSLRKTNVMVIPKSIGELQNLETLDLKETQVHDLPSEINKLKKLRHLFVYYRGVTYGFRGETGVRLNGSIGNLTSLQKLYHVEADHGGLNLMIELRKLTQLRKLGLKNVKREYRSELCVSIQEMKFLEILHISAISEDEIIDLQFISSLPQLRRLHLFCGLEVLPNWVPKLEFLVKLSFRYSKLKDDPLKSLKDLPNLLRLSITCDAYVGEIFHFEVGFQKLKRLHLIQLNNVNSIVIDKGALPALNRLQLMLMPQLKEIPSSFHLLENLESLYLTYMPHEFNQSIDPNHVGSKYWVIQRVPYVYQIMKNSG